MTKCPDCWDYIADILAGVILFIDLSECEVAASWGSKEEPS